ncbi:hypothetical protein [Thioalkalivibrio denitrificans]|uniref:hypothetical protein n=1 Tax=Thioalkalivibrio denitrificans TaxID=108003 RepID=UPI001115A45E
MTGFEIQLSTDASSPVMVSPQGELPEYGQIWVWDLLYARIMHELGEAQEASALREQLELWAVNMSSKIYQPFDHVRTKGHLNLDETLRLGEVTGPAERVRLTVDAATGELPQVRLETEATDLPPAMRARLVLALGQYFIEGNDLFARELPIHILAFRKYYADVGPAGDPESLEEAPLFAVRKALEYFQSATRSSG